MKPTEQDIKGLLIEGWEITHEHVLNPQIESCIKSPTKSTTIRFWYCTKRMRFEHIESEELIAMNCSTFLTGNYDLSAISQHYDPEEWQRIITMCESIVRLITGDYETGLDDTPEQVEQTLEEKVRGILEPVDNVCNVSVPDESTVLFDSEFHSYRLTKHKIEWVDRGDPLFDKPQFKGLVDYCRDSVHSHKAAALQKVAALLTEQPEQTLEETVRGIFSGDRDIEIEVVGKSKVRIGFTGRADIITSDGIRDGSPRDFYSVDELEDSPFAEDYVEKIEQICSLLVPKSEDTELSTRSTKPSYSELEQRVEELEKDIASDYCKENCELREEIDSLNESYEQIAETKTRVLDALEATQAELKEKKSRITDMEAQLQDYISPADHEREMANCDSLLAKVTLERDQARKDSALHLSWFYREYAKNAEASK